MSNVTIEDIEDAVRQEFSGHSPNSLPSTDAMWEACRTVKERKAKAAGIARTPGVATALIVLALFGGVVGVLVAVVGFADGSEYHIALGFSSLLSSFVIGGFGKVIEYLAKIEHHLRPQK